MTSTNATSSQTNKTFGLIFDKKVIIIYIEECNALNQCKSKRKKTHFIITITIYYISLLNEAFLNRYIQRSTPSLILGALLYLFKQIAPQKCINLSSAGGEGEG